MRIEYQTQMIEGYDVVVIGGGPAGCTAAASAAREGARTLLVERTWALGGMGTTGLVPLWCPFSDREKIIYRGLAEYVFNESKKGTPHVQPGRLDWVPIDAEHLMRVYDALLAQHGAEVLFGALFVSATRSEAQPARIEAVHVATKGGMFSLKAPVFVDCTGDADVAASCGVPMSKGDEATGLLQAATHCFALSNVDTFAYTYFDRTCPFHASNPHSVIHRILASGKYPLIQVQHFNPTITAPGTVSFNAGHLYGVDGTDPFSVSKAMAAGRALAKAYRDALAEFCPEVFGNCVVAKTGSVMGIRETRRIHGDYILTVEDYLARRSFPDEICRNSYCIDIHTSHKDLASNEALRKQVRIPPYGPGESHGIPYRCLLPLTADNLLVAGRSISVERPVQGSIRVMPVCLAMGEAAGLAAALSLPDGSPRHVDVAVLRDRLKACGAYLP